MYYGVLYTLISPGSERNISAVTAGLDSDISAVMVEAVALKSKVLAVESTHL